MKKIAFIGIMGCGKSSMAKDISRYLELQYISIDEMIEHELNLSIYEIFNKYGESFFRNIESEVLKKYVVQGNFIIDCGGGIILNKKNIEVLKENNYIIIFIDRKPEYIINNLDKSNRPLLEENSNTIHEIYNKRIEFYIKYSDYIVENNQDYDDSLKAMINLIESL